MITSAAKVPNKCAQNTCLLYRNIVGEKVACPPALGIPGGWTSKESCGKHCSILPALATVTPCCTQARGPRVSCIDLWATLILSAPVPRASLRCEPLYHYLLLQCSMPHPARALLGNTLQHQKLVVIRFLHLPGTFQQQGMHS